MRRGWSFLGWWVVALVSVSGWAYVPWIVPAPQVQDAQAIERLPLPFFTGWRPPVWTEKRPELTPPEAPPTLTAPPTVGSGPIAPASPAGEPPSTLAPSDSGLRPRLAAPAWSRSLAPPAPAPQRNQRALFSSLPGSATEFLLRDRTLTKSQREQIRNILRDYEQSAEVFAQSAGPLLEELIRLLDANPSARTAAAVLQRLRELEAQRRSLQDSALEQLRGVLSESQWGRLERWMEQRPHLPFHQATERPEPPDNTESKRDDHE
ncbi:MAG: hypothetical protein KatS3mg115_2048 [Candidatus Poribacteria bacterium]|nr:MAG: hypothetical protein KatS3mg115_2048 [Candidatus Poribacteria bacterium]